MKSLRDYISETEQDLAEKAKSQQQQKFFGMVHAMQKGEKIPGASTELKKVARTMGKKDVKDYAKTKHKGLPKRVGEQQVNEIDIDSLNQLASHAVNTLGQGGANFAAGATGGLVGGAIAGGAKKAVDWYDKRKEKKAREKRNKLKQQGLLADSNDNQVNEISLGDYHSKANKDRALSQMSAVFDPDPEKREKFAHRAKMRARGLARSKARMEKARQEQYAKARAEALAADREGLDSFKAKLADLERQFDPNYEYSDDHSFWSKQRDIKNSIDDLRRRIAAAERPTSEGINESILNDSAGDLFDHIIKRFRHEVKTFMDTGELDSDLYDALYDYYADRGEMPYGVAKARTGDPYEWVANRLENDLEVNEDLGAVTKPPFNPSIRPEDIPAYRRKHNARLGNFPAPGLVPPPPGDNSEKISDLAYLRKMAGLPHDD